MTRNFDLIGEPKLVRDLCHLLEEIGLLTVAEQVILYEKRWARMACDSGIEQKKEAARVRMSIFGFIRQYGHSGRKKHTKKVSSKSMYPNVLDPQKTAVVARKTLNECIKYL
jgi:hypothetical protein